MPHWTSRRRKPLPQERHSGLAEGVAASWSGWPLCPILWAWRTSWVEQLAAGEALSRRAAGWLAGPVGVREQEMLRSHDPQVQECPATQMHPLLGCLTPPAAGQHVQTAQGRQDGGRADQDERRRLHVQSRGRLPRHERWHPHVHGVCEWLWCAAPFSKPGGCCHAGQGCGWSSADQHTSAHLCPASPAHAESPCLPRSGGTPPGWPSQRSAAGPRALREHSSWGLR
jgi:hypothetical protein